MKKTKNWQITDEHNLKIPTWNKRWCELALSTGAIDYDKTVSAVRAMYRSAGLEADDLRFANVLSPMMGAVVVAFAAEFYAATDAATDAATLAATLAATDAATLAATLAATDAATLAATYAATRAATAAATLAATDAATDAATAAATCGATYAATRAATYAATLAATAAATHAATAAATHAATAAATRAATYAATLAATYAATDAATHAATHAATLAATLAATHAATAAAARAATYAATLAATYAATDAATHAATYAATRAATLAATHAATYAATYAATDAATRAATVAATAAATYAATDAATRAATAAATAENLSTILIMIDAADNVVTRKLGRSVRASAMRRLGNWYLYYNGGSEWSPWCCYLSFVRDVIGWESDTHKNYADYETAAIHGGPRFMHKNFVLLSDRAIVRKTDEDGRPHCEDGPALAWGCGTKVWSLNGVVVDEQVVMRPETQTVKQIDGEDNNDVRAIRIDRFGWPSYLKESQAKCVSERRNEIEGTLEALYRTEAGDQRLVVTCPTGRVFALGVPTTVKTCEAAQHWLSGSKKLRVLART